jgi:hypothetical protein
LPESRCAAGASQYVELVPVDCQLLLRYSDWVKKKHLVENGKNPRVNLVFEMLQFGEEKNKKNTKKNIP